MQTINLAFASTVLSVEKLSFLQNDTNFNSLLLKCVWTYRSDIIMFILLSSSIDTIKAVAAM